MSLYQKIKSAITVRQVGEMYGMEPDRQETFLLEEFSKSPLHFATHRDESVIVDYYTSKEVHLRSPSPLDEPRKEGCPWQEMMVLTAPVSETLQIWTHSTPSSALHSARSTRRSCLVSSADRCSVSSVRVCGRCALPCMICPSIWHGLRYCLRCAGVPGALEWTAAHRRGIQPPPSPARSVPQPPKK